MSIKAILFDFDGTLANTTDIILAGFHKACREVLQHEVTDEEIIKTFGLTLKAGMEVLADRPEQVDPMRDIYREYFYTNHDAMIKPLPGVAEAIAKLDKQGIKMAVVTSKRRPMALRGLECVGLDRFIKVVIACDDVVQRKPAPDAMLAAIDRLAVRPEECLCVGDSPFDLQSGHNAGTKAAAVTYTLFNWEEMLQQGKPDYIINSIEDLLKIIENDIDN